MLLKLPRPEAERLRTFRWFITVVITLRAIAAVELVFAAPAGG